MKWWSAWGDASRIAFTGPSRPPKASLMGTKPSCLRCMAYCATHLYCAVSQYFWIRGLNRFFKINLFRAFWLLLPLAF